MDLTKASPKFLFTLAKNFVASEGITPEEVENEAFFESDSLTEYGEKILDFLKERGLNQTDDEDYFFYSFIKENMREIFSTDFNNNFSSLSIPKLRTYRYNWDTKENLTIQSKYQHEYKSYLDPYNAELQLEYDRYNNNVYPEDGKQIYHDVLDRESYDDDIEDFHEVS